jgi:dihydroflavonol-4-reductase
VPDPAGPGCVVDEDAAGGTALTDPYSTTKAEAEAVVLDAVAAGSIDAVVATVVNAYGPSPRGPRSYNGLLVAAARGEVGEIVDTRVGWVLAEDVAAGELLALEHGEAGRRYVLCGEVAAFPTVLDTYCAREGSPHRVRALPEGSELAADAPPFADRSVVYGHLGGYRVRDDGARALGFTARGIEEGLTLTARWLQAM